MKNIAGFLARTAFLTLLGLMSTSALAQVTSESGDAGNSLATAQSVNPGTTQINGTIGADAFDPLAGRVEPDVDMYEFVLGSGTTLTIQVNANVPGDPDMNLLVFNASGQFLAGDDDNDGSCSNVVPFLDGLDSCLTLSLSAGTYYFAVGENNIGAFETVADFLFSRSDYFESNDSGILGSPTTETVAIAGAVSNPPSDPDEQGPYTVYFSSAVNGSATASTISTVPVMPVWLLGLMIGLLGLLGSRRFKIGQ
jgi:hypothetical protein